MVRRARLAGAACVVLALSGCGPTGQTTTATTQTTTQTTQQLGAAMQARVAAALDPCAQSGQANAPNNNQSAFARNVCANSSLAALDTQIRTALAAKATQISDAGALVLIQNQQRWREAQRVACGIAGAAAAPNAQQQQCLEGRFRARAAEAGASVQSMGGYTFQAVEQVAAAPTPQALAASGGEPATMIDVRYPRIDGPQTPAIQRFNALVQQNPQFRPEQGTNETTRYRISYAGPGLISVRFDTSDDTPGAAQTNTNVKAVNVLMAEGRTLTAADVFKPNSGWEDFITQRAVADIARQFRDYDNFSPPVRDVHETATKPHLWLITQQGLTLLFPPLSFGGSYDMAGAEVSIPWADLRPYLNPNAPAPIRPQS